MSLSNTGTNISDCSITSINDLGIWILVDDKEYFLPFRDYPGFKEAPINQILNVQWLKPSQLRWDSLDIDVELHSLLKPESFPLIYRS